MLTDIQEYVNANADCKRTKLKHHFLYKELQSLFIPKKLQQDWMFNFITDLSPSVYWRQIFDTVLVMKNGYIKFTKYIPACKDWEGENIADILVKKIFIKYGKPVSFMNNCNSLFTSKFWSYLCYYLSIRLEYSIVFYPQTNRQIEYQNQTLEQYLQGFVNYQQDNWVFWLSLVEYVYNNSIYLSTEISPFEALFGEKLSWENIMRKKKTMNILTARK